MNNKIDPKCEHTRIRLIAAALGHQQCTNTAGTEVLIPGTDKRILIGSDAYLAMVARRAAPSCGACPGDGSICPTSCKLAAESPPLAGAPAAETSLPEDVAALFGTCGFEIRSTDPAEQHPFAVCGSLDAAGLLVETVLTGLGQHDSESVPAEFVALLPGVTYMDPRDGGSVSVLEQFRRMAQDAARYRWLRDKSEPGICTFYLSVGQAFKDVRFAPETVDHAIDAQIAKPLAEAEKEMG